jgi:flagellar biosynthesis GTPase FlhF|nr:MAG TPA: helix-turn-helix domain protein [Caudoviricetes sp.]
MEKEYYINIQWWMAQRLKLSGNELLTYAIVYGFSQDGESTFLGSSKYVSYALRVSRPTAIKCLDSLTSKGLIIKTQEKINDIVFNRYKANLQIIKNFDRPYKETLQGDSKETLQGGSKETLHSNNYKELNNKELNKEINNKESKKEESNNTQNRQVEISEELKQMQKEIEQLKAENKKLKTKKEKPKKKAKSYDEQITEYTENEELQNALKAFVQMRAFIKSPVTEHGLKLLLNKLTRISRNDAEKITIVNNSIENNWKGFYGLKEETSYQKSVQPEKKYDQNGYESEEDLMAMFYGK